MDNPIPIALMNIHKTDEPEFVDFRIVGGNAVTNSRRFPWMTSLQNNGRHFCGAMLIHPSWLLSAKHCIKITSSPTVMIGGLDLNNTGEFIMRKVKRIVEHDTLDVALLELDQPVNDRIPIKVNNNPNIPVNTNTEAVGWGRLSENGSLTSLLQEVVLPIVPDEKCTVLYPGKYQINQHVCAGVEAGKKDACQGDSGGPLIIMWDESDNTTQFLIGVTSWGIGCAREGKFGVWVRTSTIIPWISQHISGFIAYDAMAMANRSKMPGISPITNPPNNAGPAPRYMPPPGVIPTNYNPPLPPQYPPGSGGYSGGLLPPPLPFPGAPPPPSVRMIEYFNFEYNQKYQTILIYILIIVILLSMILYLKKRHVI
jgi:secreted trypsin-like serine protease